jgi:hypothetical protein
MFEESLDIPEAGVRFYGKNNFWRIENIQTGQTIRMQEVDLFWFFERAGNKVVVVSETEAECVEFSGATFHKVMVDPPHHITHSETQWVFNCEVMGQQILKIK